ncbi:4'-phosphopantetheinyl transferase family protein [Parasphingorhabdus pacifica]
MLEEILPGDIASAESFTDPPEATLYASEAAAVAHAVSNRRREFTTARFCARRAMRALGVPPAPLLPGERGAPNWPEGVVGSMTHCAGYRAAAAGSTSTTVTVGVDAEPHEKLPGGVLKVVSTETEHSHLAALSETVPEVRWDRLLFSCKEAVYKAWFPITGEWLGFADAELTFDTGGGFNARLNKKGPDIDGAPLIEFDGRWLVRDGLVLTAVSLLRRS